MRGRVDFDAANQIDRCQVVNRQSQPTASRPPIPASLYEWGQFVRHAAIAIGVTVVVVAGFMATSFLLIDI
jgi:hypothetical protein